MVSRMKDGVSSCSGEVRMTRKNWEVVLPVLLLDLPL
jgi:hypothetical protein